MKAYVHGEIYAAGMHNLAIRKLRDYLEARLLVYFSVVVHDAVYVLHYNSTSEQSSAATVLSQLRTY